MRSLLMMLTFLTRIPIKYPYEYRKEDFIRGVILMPLIGLIIGLILWGISFLANYIDRPVVSLLIWIVYIWVTGGLHIDGLADSVDGLYSNRDKDRMLEIMKDSRIGTFGVLSIFFIFSLNIVLTNYIDYMYIVLVPVIGRSCALLACSISQYAREGEGMGKAVIENCGLREGITAFIFPTIIGIILFSFKLYSHKFLIAILLSMLFTLLSTRYIKGKLGGMTGDNIGFIIETSQTAFLISLYILSKVMI